MTGQEQQKDRQVRRRCKSCAGAGVIERTPAGAGQLQSLPEAPRQPGDDGAGEGPPTQTETVELVACPACGGVGRETVRLSQAEYEVLRRRRLWRGVVLIFAGMIPFLLLLGAILAQPESLCGRPWYGVGGLLLLVIVGRRFTT